MTLSLDIIYIFKYLKVRVAPYSYFFNNRRFVWKQIICIALWVPYEQTTTWRSIKPSYS